MHIIMFVDETNGLMFGDKRQTRDRQLINFIKATNRGTKIWCSHYTAELFEGELENVIIDNDFLDKAEPFDLCIVEGQNLRGYLDDISSIRLYRWMRKYPATLHLDSSLLAGRRLISKETLYLDGTHRVVEFECWM